MCFGQAMRQYVVPDAYLTNMLKFLMVIGFINFGVSLLRLISGDFMSMLYDLINVFILYMAYKSVFFVCMAMYIIFSILTSFYLFVAIGTWVQNVFQNFPSTTNDYVAFGVNLFIFFFYVFAIIFTFRIYREMKAQFYSIFSSQVYQGNNKYVN